MAQPNQGEREGSRRRLRRVKASVFAACVGLAAARPAAAQPELPGPYAFEVWKTPPGAPVPCPMGIFHPMGAPSPGAPVVLVHGGGESGDYKVKMAELLASRGLVAIVPTFPFPFSSPGPAEGDQVDQLLEWAVAQSASASTPIAGKIDPAQYGVAGHSNGGIVFYAASANPKIKAIVGWDAVAGLNGTSGFSGPSLHLLGDGSTCGGGSSQGYNAAPAPKAKAVVSASSHCDYNDPASPFCVTVCGTPPYSPQAAAMIERYSVAWLVCLLGHDASMQQYVDFGGAQEGLTQMEQQGSIACQGGGSGGAGTGGTSGASTGGTGGSSGVGASDGGPEVDGGCSCRTAPGGGKRGLALAAALLLGAIRARARRRKAVAPQP
jgi:MYXO-CTERM domain-containing protein